jgi:dolichol-phosphate mannosyltransferase/undecaprenyl-phosphate 4-deoxy-4-formamido-L-arabinose transferase
VLNQTKYSVVVPVYNTTEVLFSLVDSIETTMKEYSAEYEIILVNDNSPNIQSWQIIKSLSESRSYVKGVQLSRNFGQQSATLCGLALSTGDYVITMDDDYQHNPADIPLLIEESLQYDIVIAHFIDKKHSYFKKMTSAIKGYFDHLILDKPKGIHLSAFRLLSRNVVDGMLAIKTPTPFIPALMFFVSKNVISVKMPHYQRKEGQSGYTVYKLIKLFSYLIINNSSLLLRFIGYIGLLLSLGSFILVIYFTMRRVIFDTAIEGWTSTIILILFFGGFQLFTLGIIGEYLIRIVRGVEEKPSYIIKEMLD